QQRLLQNMMDSIPSAISLKDLHGKYILINKKAEELYGLPANRIIGYTDRGIIKDENRYHRFKTLDDEIHRYKAIRTLEESVEVKGEKRYIWITKFPLLNEKGNVTNICGLATDITERKEVELNLINAKKEAEAAKA